MKLEFIENNMQELPTNGLTIFRTVLYSITDGQKSRGFVSTNRVFFQDNFLTAKRSLYYHGEMVKVDELTKPFSRKFYYILWFEKTRIRLPGLVKQQYRTEFRNKILSSTKSEIFQALWSILEKFKSNEDNIVMSSCMCDLKTS